MKEFKKWNIHPFDLEFDVRSYLSTKQLSGRAERSWSIYATRSGFYGSTAFNVRLNISAYHDHPWRAYVSFKYCVALLKALSLTSLEMTKSGTFPGQRNTPADTVGSLTFMISME